MTKEIKLIIGIGNDLIEKERVKKACEKDAFLSYVFTEAEIELIKKKKDSAAGNWAVKEAVAKAMGTGFFGMKIKEIEVLRDELGKPYVKLYGKALEKQKALGIERFFVSISDTKEYTSAVAVAEG